MGEIPDPTAGQFHTYSEINDELHQLANTFPNIATVTSIGQSLEGRELWGIKISDNVNMDESESIIVLLGAHHAREWISVEVPFLIAKHFA